MISQFFTLIKMALALFGAWELFQDWLLSNHRAELERRKERLDQTIKDAQEAKTPEDAWDAQERITDNDPLG